MNDQRWSRNSYSIKDVGRSFYAVYNVRNLFCVLLNHLWITAKYFDFYRLG